jgi:hypothetical protein
MTDTVILANHGFTAAQAARAIAKPVAKRTAREQTLIVALLGASL